MDDMFILVQIILAENPEHQLHVASCMGSRASVVTFCPPCATFD